MDVCPVAGTVKDMREYGKPASWAAKQKWSRRGKATRDWALIVLLVLAAAGLIYVLATQDMFGTNVVLVTCVVVALAAGACIYKLYVDAKKDWKKAGQARIGVTSEKKVRRVVRRNQPPIAVYGMTFGPRGGDCDLIVVTRNLGLAAIEIKTGFGKVVEYGNQIRAGRRIIPGDPLGQASRNSDKLQKALNYTTSYPIVCIPGMTTKPFRKNGVIVCASKDLFSVIDQLPPSFDDLGSAEHHFARMWEKHLATAH